MDFLQLTLHIKVLSVFASPKKIAPVAYLQATHSNAVSAEWITVFAFIGLLNDSMILL